MTSQASSGQTFRISKPGPVYVRPVATTNAEMDPVTLYIRWRVHQVLGNSSQVALAKKVGVSPALLSQVKNARTGTGPRSVEKWVAALGFSSVQELQRAAWSWHLADAKVGASLMTEPKVAEAIRVVRGLHPDVTDEALIRVLTAFGSERFRRRGTDWWTRVLLEELRQDEVI